MTDKLPETLVCLPADLVNGFFEGFTDNSEQRLEIIEKDIMPHLVCLERDGAEINTNYKQLVAYIVIHYRDKVLIYNRGVGEGEGRLASKWGCIGGHVNIDDAIHTSRSGCTQSVNSFEFMVRAAASREYHEELHTWQCYECCVGYEHFDIIGYININDTLVDAVHLGVVLELHVDKMLRPNTGDAKITYINKHELSLHVGRMYDSEKWLKLVARYYGDVK